MRTFVVVIAALLVTPTGAAAQSCARCDHVLAAGVEDFDGAAAGVGPGDVVCIEAGPPRITIRIANVHGDADAPVTFLNCNGQVVIDNEHLGYGLRVTASSFFRVTGTG